MNVPTAQWLADNGSNPTHVGFPLTKSVNVNKRGWWIRQGRTNTKSTNNAYANTTGDPAQEAVPCTWHFTNAVHVIIW